MADEQKPNQLPDAEIAERMDRAFRRIATTAPKPRNRITPKEGARKPREKPDHKIETSENY